MCFRRLFLFLIVCIFTNLLTLANDSVTIKLADKSIFKGYLVNQEPDSIYFGTMYDAHLREFVGFWNKDLSMRNVYCVGANKDSTLCNWVGLMNQYRYEYYDSNMYKVTYIYGAAVFEKLYSYADKSWCTSVAMLDNSFLKSRKYDTDSFILNEIEEDDEMDSIMIPILQFSIIAVALILLWGPLIDYKDGKGNVLPVLYITSAVVIILYFIFTTAYLRSQLVFPMLTLFLPYALRFFSRGIKYIIAHFVLSGIILVFWGWFLFFNLDEVVYMSDGTPVKVHWQSGTDMLKRHVVKKTITTLLPVKVRDHNTDYVLYVSKYELSKGDFAVINNEIFAWISYLLSKEPLCDLSYREARVVLERFKMLSNVSFDFLSYNEWKCVSSESAHNIDKNEIPDIDDGEPNKYGLVNIAGNLPEYTSTFVPTPRLAMSGDTICNEYNLVFVSGNPDVFANGLDCSVVDKDVCMRDVGIRLIYRPDNICARRFLIQGIAVDGAPKEFPKEILLDSYDDVPILIMSDYDSFKEMVVEKRFKRKKISVYDITTKRRLKLEIPAGQELYDFTPIFFFPGSEIPPFGF